MLKTVLVFALGAISALAITATAQQPNSTKTPPVFSINLEVVRAENGVRMKCTEGCAWETLSFSCDPNGPDCEGSFDQFGTPAD